MTWFMMLKVRDQQEELSMRSMFHVLVALVLIPLLAVKIVIARRYRSYQSALVPLGLTILCSASFWFHPLQVLTCFAA